MIDTGRDLDVAVQGNGWMAVQTPDGGEAYTRTSSMVDALGVLRDGNGLPVMGNSGPIAVPPQQQIEIGADGTISVRSLGESPQVMAEIDRIKLVKPDLKNMEKGPDGLMHTKDGKPAQADADVQVESGFLQSSNVNAVDEMTSVLALSRNSNCTSR
jgi:flagellar basal-body rod protein FlgF